MYFQSLGTTQGQWAARKISFLQIELLNFYRMDPRKQKKVGLARVMSLGLILVPMEVTSYFYNRTPQE